MEFKKKEFLDAIAKELDSDVNVKNILDQEGSEDNGQNRAKSNSVDSACADQETTLRNDKAVTSGGYYGCVQKILQQTSAATLGEFSLLDTDMRRVVFARNLKYIEPMFSIAKYQSKKNLSLARKCRESGNELYMKKDYLGAISYYTRSILNAPVTNDLNTADEEFSLALANRSAATFQLGKYDLALRDMELCLKHGYSRDLRFKLFDRMGKCYYQMKRFKEAKVSFTNGKVALSESVLSETKRGVWLKNIEEAIKGCSSSNSKESSNNTDEEPFNKEVPSAKKPFSQRFSHASDAFDVQYDDRKGRYVVSTSNVNIGDMIVSEPALACVLAPDKYTTHCYHCLKMLEVPIACIECNTVRYCSGECRDSSWKVYHSTECSYLSLINESGIGFMGHLALRLILIIGLKTLLQRRVCNRDGTKIMVDSRNKYEGKYEALLDMVGHSSERNPNEMFQYTILTLFILKILKHADFFKTEDMGDRKALVVENYISGIILRILQVLCCNAVQIMETRYSVNIQKAEQNTLGLGLFPTIALINHSCNPNMELIFYGNSCVARLIRTVLAGEELAIDYGFVYYLTESTVRLHSLKSQYHFECSCEPCIKNWPLRAQLPTGIPPLKCIKCSSSICGAKKDGSDPNCVRCSNCFALLTPLYYLEEYYNSSRQYEKALSQIRIGDYMEQSKILANHLVTLEKYMILPIKEYAICLSALKQCYRVMGNSVQNNPNTRAKSNSFCGFSTERW